VLQLKLEILCRLW